MGRNRLIFLTARRAVTSEDFGPNPWGLEWGEGCQGRNPFTMHGCARELHAEQCAFCMTGLLSVVQPKHKLRPCEAKEASPFAVLMYLPLPPPLV